MNFVFLVEDQSGKILLERVLAHYRHEYNNAVDYNIHAYRGIGGFPKGKKPKEAKSEQLLNDLPKRMRAIQAKYQYQSDNHVALFVVVDNDNRETEAFRNELRYLAERNQINMDYVFCIAIEEIEAWLLGDYAALQAAYPELGDRILSKHSVYVQDSICGTWEFLAELLTEGGRKEFFRNYSTPFEIGKVKAEWADRIGKVMDIRRNNSPSFNYLISEMDRRMNYK